VLRGGEVTGNLSGAISTADASCGVRSSTGWPYAAQVAFSCQYPECPKTAATILLIERDDGVMRLRVCDAHRALAREITRRYDGVAYRLRPI